MNRSAAAIVPSLVAVLMALLLVPTPAQAVEGSCSWHGGVNCSVGPDWDGSAICNDGWPDSGERYFEQIKCQSTPMCTQYLWKQMSNTESMRDSASRYYDLIATINRLNLEYPLIEINMQESFRGRGITHDGAAVLIKGAKTRNRNSVATSTYVATILDQTLRSEQFEINNMCRASGEADAASLEESKSVQITPHTAEVADLSGSPYKNVRERKIFREVRMSYAFNTDIGCEKLGIMGEDLAMCKAFAADPSKDLWRTIERPDSTVILPTQINAVVPGSAPAVQAQTAVPVTARVAPVKASTLQASAQKSQIAAVVAVAVAATPVAASTTPEIVDAAKSVVVPAEPQKTSFWQGVANWFASWFR
jgi:hypothetical protein